MQGFASGYKFGSNAYLTTIDGGAIENCNIAYEISGSLSNAGERMAIVGVTIGGCNKGISIATGDLYIYNCSFDYGYGPIIEVISSKVYMFGCHLEDRYWPVPPIVVTGNGARLYMYGGTFGHTNLVSTTIAEGGCDLNSPTIPITSPVFNTPGKVLINASTFVTFTGYSDGMLQGCSAHPAYSGGEAVVKYIFADYIINCDASAWAGGVVLDGCAFHYIRTESGRIATGGGPVIARNSYGYENWFSNRILGDAQNKLYDGGFEQVAISDDIFISGDTAPITSRVTGINISLATSTAQARSGSRSLLITTGSGNTAKFAIAVPITLGAICNFEAYYRKPGNETGSVTVTSQYGTMKVNSNCVPEIMAKSSAISSKTITFTSTDVPWTKTQGIHVVKQAPNWATHFIIEFNLSAFKNAKLYLDDFIITEM
ncbi:MAG TPA: hypothetical protein PKV43_03805 [Armatimonadota bacterium]|nr:hypothetical protein [Armatimonadota bacterium]